MKRQAPGAENPAGKVTCPVCQHAFELGAALRGQLEGELREQLAAELKTEADARRALEVAEAVRAKDVEVAVLKKKADEATAREVALLRAKAELDARERSMPVEIEKQVAARLNAERARAAQEAAVQQGLEMEAMKLALAERDEKLKSMTAKVEALQKQATQGSQQLQGEAQEIVLEDVLVAEFPDDLIVEVAKGRRGADVDQTVRDRQRRDCGVILWESKRAKHWGGDWLAKFREDMRVRGATCGVIVSAVLPEGVKSFGLVEDVWVCNLSYAVPLAWALRQGLLESAVARRSVEGHGHKMQALYAYMTGHEFRNSVEGAIEAFAEMRAEIDKEERNTLARWKRQRGQLNRAMRHMVGIYGDVQGIAGADVEDLPVLSATPSSLPRRALRSVVDEAEDTEAPDAAEADGSALT